MQGGASPSTLQVLRLRQKYYTGVHAHDDDRVDRGVSPLSGCDSACGKGHGAVGNTKLDGCGGGGACKAHAMLLAGGSWETDRALQYVRKGLRGPGLVFSRLTGGREWLVSECTPIGRTPHDVNASQQNRRLGVNQI